MGLAVTIGASVVDYGMRRSTPKGVLLILLIRRQGYIAHGARGVIRGRDAAGM